MTENSNDQAEHPRTDDRNEEIDDSPAPDPTEGDTSAEDVPQAD
jgi:hypothetical protein